MARLSVMETRKGLDHHHEDVIGSSILQEPFFKGNTLCKPIVPPISRRVQFLDIQLRIGPHPSTNALVFTL